MSLIDPIESIKRETRLDCVKILSNSFLNVNELIKQSDLLSKWILGKDPEPQESIHDKD